MPHVDIPASHGDTGHVDQPQVHGDTLHVDDASGHLDAPHIDSPLPHADTPHVDGSAFGVHGDTLHADTNHADTPHGDGSTGLHLDTPHADGTASVHIDTPHGDTTTPHVDIDPQVPLPDLGALIGVLGGLIQRLDALLGTLKPPEGPPVTNATPLEVMQQIVQGINGAEQKLNEQNFVIAAGTVEAKLNLPIAGVTVTFNITPRPYN